MGYVMRNAHNILIGKLKRKRTHQRPRHRWEDILKLIFRKLCVKVLSRLNWAQWLDFSKILLNLNLS